MSRRIVLVAALIGMSFMALGAGVAAEHKPRAKTAAPSDEASHAAVAPVVVPPHNPHKVTNGAPAWTVSCFSSARAVAPDCRIEQRLLAKETGRIVSIATIEIPGNTRQPVLVMHLPTGLALQRGVSLGIDGGAATPLQWQSCDGAGCYATLTLTPALLQTMGKGKVMTVKTVMANGQALAFEHLLTDFSRAYEAAK